MTDVIVEFYRAKIALADECEERKEFTNIEIAGDDQLCEGCNVALYFISVLSRPLCDSRMLQNSRILQNVTGPQPTNLLKKRLWPRCLPVKFVKFLRTPFYAEHLCWLLL